MVAGFVGARAALPLEPMQGSLVTMGLDLGQANDYSAAVGLAQTTYSGGFVGPRDPRYRAPTIRRWDRNTDYNDVVGDVLEYPYDVLVVDYTGVGRPVYDMLARRARRGKIVPVTIVSSHVRGKVRSSERGSVWSVPKIDLMSAVKVLNQRRMLRLPDMRESRMLIDEMDRFEKKMTRASHVTLEARRGHDDLVIALGLACWWVLRGRKFAAYVG